MQTLTLFGGTARFKLSDLGADASVDIGSHPNQMPVSGVVVLLDRPSDQAPHGSDGHRIMVPSQAARKSVKSLVGQGLNYESDLEGHAPRRKVGVITAAEIVGKEIRIRGVIWKKDFPEAERLLKAHRGELGMSMELAHVTVEDTDADVWVLQDFQFTGATILKKDAAAYHLTSLAASAMYKTALAAANAALGLSKENAMGNEVNKDKKIAEQRLATVMAAAIETSNKPLLEAIQASNENMSKLTKAVLVMGTSMNKNSTTIQASLDKLSASRAGEKERDELDELEELLASADVDIEAAKKGKKGKDDASEDSSADSTDDASDDPSDMDAADASVDPSMNADADPSADSAEMDKQNEDAGSHKNKGGAVAGGVKAAAAKVNKRVLNIVKASAQKIGDLAAANAKLSKENKAIQNQLKAQRAQLELYASRVERKSITPEVSMILEKSGHNVSELMASGQKLTVGQVDAALANSGVTLDPKERMSIKNQLLQQNMMEMGAVNRHQHLQ